MKRAVILVLGGLLLLGGVYAQKKGEPLTRSVQGVVSDVEDAIVDMECLPPSLAGKQYYFPTARGVEQRIQERLQEIRKRKSESRIRPSGSSGP